MIQRRRRLWRRWRRLWRRWHIQLVVAQALWKLLQRHHILFNRTKKTTTAYFYFQIFLPPSSRKLIIIFNKVWTPLHFSLPRLKRDFFAENSIFFLNNRISGEGRSVLFGRTNSLLKLYSWQIWLLLNNILLFKVPDKEGSTRTHTAVLREYRMTIAH